MCLVDFGKYGKLPSKVLSMKSSSDILVSSMTSTRGCRMFWWPCKCPILTDAHTYCLKCADESWITDSQLISRISLSDLVPKSNGFSIPKHY